MLALTLRDLISRIQNCTSCTIDKFRPYPVLYMGSFDEVELLRRRAYEFFRHAQDALSHREFDLACFFAEQAAQLRAKSPIPRTHGLRELLELILKALQDLLKGEKIMYIRESLERERQWLRTLEEAYTIARYGLRTYDPEEARHCVDLAKTLIELLDNIEEKVFSNERSRN